jgi:hypothetical protein
MEWEKCPLHLNGQCNNGQCRWNFARVGYGAVGIGVRHEFEYMDCLQDSCPIVQQGKEIEQVKEESHLTTLEVHEVQNPCIEKLREEIAELRDAVCSLIDLYNIEHYGVTITTDEDGNIKVQK